MDEVTIRDLRNHGAEVLERVRRGEALTVTRAGRPAAELRPLPRQPATAEALPSGECDREFAYRVAELQAK